MKNIRLLVIGLCLITIIFTSCAKTNNNQGQFTTTLTVTQTDRQQTSQLDKPQPPKNEPQPSTKSAQVPTSTPVTATTHAKTSKPIQDKPTSTANQTSDNSSQYSLSQAMSDQAQLSTIAFSGLGFITGNAGADTFFPPGKVADFFGFQYMRDVDIASYGHNTLFFQGLPIMCFTS